MQVRLRTTTLINNLLKSPLRSAERSLQFQFWMNFESKLRSSGIASWLRDQGISSTETETVGCRCHCAARHRDGDLTAEAWIKIESRSNQVTKSQVSWRKTPETETFFENVWKCVKGWKVKGLSAQDPLLSVRRASSVANSKLQSTASSSLNPLICKYFSTATLQTCTACRQILKGHVLAESQKSQRTCHLECKTAKSTKGLLSRSLLPSLLPISNKTGNTFADLHCVLEEFAAALQHKCYRNWYLCLSRRR